MVMSKIPKFEWQLVTVISLVLRKILGSVEHSNALLVAIIFRQYAAAISLFI